MRGVFRKLREFRGTVMSTEILIKADLGKDLLEEAYEMARDYERKLSAYREDSFILKINRHAGISPVKCPLDVVNLIKEAVKIAQETGGLFDPTVGVLTQGLYGFGTGQEKIPVPSEVERLKRLVNYRKVKIRGNEVFLEEEGMRLDLGGIAKGWTAQKLAEFLIDMGATEVLVSIGGEICTFGRRWRIAIKSPDGKGHMGIIETKEGKTTISTSGDYERFIETRDTHHILNPGKGNQENFYLSLTLVEDDFCGARLDALTTACFNLPVERMKTLTDSFLALRKQEGDLVIGPGLKGKVRGLYLILS